MTSFISLGVASLKQMFQSKAHTKMLSDLFCFVFLPCCNAKWQLLYFM